MLWQRNRIIAVVLLLMVFALGFLLTRQKNDSLVQSSVSQATLLPSPTPMEIKYDDATDLNKELESVNPQVLEGDFTDSGL